MGYSINRFAIFISVFVSLILTILPMPGWTEWFRPAWVLLVLIIWTLEIPYLINIGLAWFMGLLLDVLNGTLLGEHALALTLVIYIVAHMQARMRMFSLLQQSLIVFLLVALYQFILYCVQGFLGDAPRGWLYWGPSFTSILLYPWLYGIMRTSRHPYKAV